ncbi:hypothetical protein K438DRAFT_1749471 [Mycena galopus ATCC 62051]|nr:hypothetical protein K438DRAFT_1749471 [Mycena galopus ATCC 62051]
MAEAKRDGHPWGRSIHGYLSTHAGRIRPVSFFFSTFQLILGDYFKVYPYAAEIAEKATGLIAWINDHGKFAVLQSRSAIIAAQVGAAKSTEAEQLKEEAIHYCQLISDTSFWSGLNSIVEDIEPICLNKNQPERLYSRRSGSFNLYRRVMSYPGNDDTPQQRGKDPIRMWTALIASAEELATFATTVLKVVINTGVKADHLAEGFTPAHREPRENHKSVEKLLAVPRYRDFLEDQDDEDDTERGRAQVSSSTGWRIDMAGWISAARAAEEAEETVIDSDDETTPVKSVSTSENSASTSRLSRHKTRKWVKTTLAGLFGGAPKPVRKFTEANIDAEAELMEALAEAEEDARPDDGAIECSEDEYILIPVVLRCLKVALKIKPYKRFLGPLRGPGSSSVRKAVFCLALELS